METPSILFKRLKSSKKIAYGANDSDFKKIHLIL